MPTTQSSFLAGTQDVQLPQPLVLVATVHSELQLTVIAEFDMEYPAAGCWPERSANDAEDGTEYVQSTHVSETLKQFAECHPS